jgi:biotin-(acetyl-CoA carboxylase) ligase
MSPNSILFTSASIANILWTEYGFDIDQAGGVENLSEDIKAVFDSAFDAEIAKTVKSFIMNPSEYTRKLDLNIKGESIILIRYQRPKQGSKNNDAYIDELILRVNLCDRKKNMKTKILYIVKIKFPNDLDVSKTANVVDTYVSLGRKLCEIVFNTIKDKYSLGNKNYEASIAGIGTNDNEIDCIIDAFEKAKFDEIDKSKIIDVYRLLLMDGKNFPEELPKTYEEFETLLKRYNIPIARIELTDNFKDILYLLVNLGSGKSGKMIDENYRRMVHISNVGKIGSVRNPNLLTLDIIGELVAKT